MKISNIINHRQFEKENRMFEYLVSGQYISEDKNARIGEYETIIYLSEAKADIARVVIQNVLIHPHLKKEIEDYKHWRTCEVSKGTKISPKDIPDDKKPDQELEELAATASKNGVVPITINENVSAGAKKKALKKAVDKNAAAKVRAKAKEKRARKAQGLTDVD